MSDWECPACGRSFGRTGQSHVCAPAMTVDAYFAARPANDRAIFEAVAATLAEIAEVPGDVHVEAVGVGILFKRGRTFAELRPRRAGMALSFWLPRIDSHPRITRRMFAQGNRSRASHVVPLLSADDVDESIRNWLAESYHDAAR